jgi:hypothetical protein
MNWKELGKKQSWPNRRIILSFSWGIEENHEISSGCPS